VVLWDREEPQGRATLLKAGCMAVLYQKLSDEELADTLSALVERRRQEELNLLKVGRLEPRASLQDFVSNSVVMQQFIAVVRKIMGSESSILLLGETGVGKERLARAIHQEGPRSSGPFLAVNCSALPETLLESELFGHEQGAFTGASRARRGFFELAHGGTIFLDEIGEVPLHLQVKLLRVLENRTIQRLGSEKTTRVDVRIMAATNRNLEEDVRAQGFRSDLYYRLAVVTLEVPPLRDRTEDIPALAESYLAHFCSVLGRQLNGIQNNALEALVRYSWPGNVRELINVMERAVLLASGPEIALEDLPKAISNLEDMGIAGARKDHLGVRLDSLQNLPLRKARREVVAAFEKAYLAGVLRSTRGRISEAARHAGINERSLYELMKGHGLKKEDFKAKV
jgi:DNA-binding NtrC family response regulator